MLKIHQLNINVTITIVLLLARGHRSVDRRDDGSVGFEYTHDRCIFLLLLHTNLPKVGRSQY